MKKFFLVLTLLVLSTSLFAAYTYELTVDATPDNGCPGRSRGVAVFGENDVAVMCSTSDAGSGDQNVFIYTGATGGQDVPVVVSDWTNPDLGTDTNEAQWGWGAKVSPVDGYIYGTVGGSQCPVLVWDTSGNSINFAAQTRAPDASGDYTTGLDIDDSGRVYVANYLANFAVDGWTYSDVIILPAAVAAGPWEGTDINDATHASGHNPTPIDTVDLVGYVNEGVCVVPDGSVVFGTNRSGLNAERFEGSPGSGYTAAGGFAFVAPVATGSIRGCEVSDDGNILYTVFDDSTGIGEPASVLSVNDAYTGALIESVDLTAVPSDGSAGTDPHSSAYDVEVVSDPYGTPTAQGSAVNVWVAHNYSWYVDKWVGSTDISDYTLY